MAALWSFALAPNSRPRVEGIAHMAYYVSDLNRSRAYYEDFLGFPEAFALKRPDGSDHVAIVKINDRQFIQLLAEAPRNHGLLHDVAFWTRDIEGVRASLASAGLTVPVVAKDRDGDLVLELTDPSGFAIEVLQYDPESRTGLTKGKAVSTTGISDHIDHVGLLVDDLVSASRFYGEALAFTAEKETSKRRIGDGPDRFEVGFERRPRTPERFHIKNHICLSVADVPAVVTRLQAKPAAKSYREIETHVLENGKHVAELYDPDGNRVELMEPPKTH